MSIPECCRLADFRIAWTTHATRLGWVTVIVRVQPVHVNADVVPKRNHKNHATLQCLTHGFQASLLGEIITIAKHSFLRFTEI
jgi:hypothetical protein